MNATLDLFFGSPILAMLWRLLFAYGFSAYLMKKVSNEGGRLERFLLQFVLTAILAVVVSIVVSDVPANSQLGIVAVIGFIAASGTFFKWKAISISQSKDALFTFWDDIIAMMLGVLILREGQFLTPSIGFGIALSFLAVLLFIRHDWRRKKSEGKADTSRVPLVFYGYVGFYSICWGVAVFGQRYFSFQDMPVSAFLLGWYGGTLIAATLLFLFHPEGRNRPIAPVAGKGLVLVVSLAVCIFISLGLASMAYRMPVITVQPIFLVAELIFPALIGLYIFHERKHLDPWEWSYFGVGTVGALLIGLSL